LEKTIKKMRDEKGTGDDDVPGDVINLLGDALKIVTQLINTMKYVDYSVLLAKEGTMLQD
jgi:hypothetical protein